MMKIKKLSKQINKLIKQKAKQVARPNKKLLVGRSYQTFRIFGQVIKVINLIKFLVSLIEYFF